MATKEIRQQARREARDMLAERRKQRAELERKRDGLASQVMVALAERDALVREAEVAAGRAFGKLLATDLAVSEAVEWCAGLGEKEARRLMKLAETSPAAKVTAASTP